MENELNFLRGSSDNFSNINHNINNIYLTSRDTDSDYKLYVGDKLRNYFLYK